MNKVTMYNTIQDIHMDVLKASIEENTVNLSGFWDGESGHNYREVGQFYTELSGIDAAEEAFDLSNNPARQYVREIVQGRTRSLSVGDVVKVVDYGNKPNDFINYTINYYVCLNMGWKEL